MLLTLAIATWNRSALLRQTLESVANAQCPPGTELEVLVCDNHSTDDTRTVVESLRQRLSVEYLFEPTQGKSFALNRLLQRARGEWVLFIDDDVVVDAGWLAAYVEAMRRHPEAACLGGPIQPRVDGDLSRRGRFLLQHYPQLAGQRVVQEEQPMLASDPAWGANMAVRRSEAGKGFDTQRGMFAGRREPGEDTALLAEMLSRGLGGYMVPGARVEHHVPASVLTLRRFRRTQMEVGRMLARCRPQVAAGALGGLPRWAWQRLAGLWLRAALCWRPWPSLPYYQSVARACQYYGYITAAKTAAKPPSGDA